MISPISSDLSFLGFNSTITKEHEVKSSLAICPCHHRELTLSASSTEYSVHRVQHHPRIESLLLQASFSILGGWCCTRLSTCPQFQVNQWIQSQLPSRLPPNHRLPVLLQSLSIIASECLSEFTCAWPPSACLNSLDHGLPVQVQTRLITAVKWISEFTQSWPPSASPNSLNYLLPVHLQPQSIMASKYIITEWWWLYGDTRVTEVAWAMWSIFGRPPDRWTLSHFHLILSYNENAHTVFHIFQSLSLLPRFRGYTQLRGSSRPTSIISSQLLTFLRFLSWNSSPSRILFGCHERCGRILMVGSLPCSCVVSPQQPRTGACLGSLNGNHLR